MIQGVGTDIVSIKRIEAVLEKNALKFANRILTNKELDVWYKSKQKARFLAKRFAAKEAFAKAWGTGIRHYVSFKNIEVHNDISGAPKFNFYQQLESEITNRCLNCYLSMSDDGDFAVAFVIIESLPK